MKIEGKMNTRRVWVDGRELRPNHSQQVYNHSPDGFSWGYGGSGPAQLALAILLCAGVPEDKAVEIHQDFKRDFVAQLPDDFLVDVTLSSEGKWAVTAPRQDWTRPR